MVEVGVLRCLYGTRGSLLVGSSTPYPTIDVDKNESAVRHPITDNPMASRVLDMKGETTYTPSQCQPPQKKNSALGIIDEMMKNDFFSYFLLVFSIYPPPPRLGLENG